MKTWNTIEEAIDAIMHFYGCAMEWKETGTKGYPRWSVELASPTNKILFTINLFRHNGEIMIGGHYWNADLME